MSLLLRAALPGEAELLSDLCLRSKAVWGYDAAFMAACRAELTITHQDFARSQIQVAVQDGRIIGMAQLAQHGRIADIDKLFVDPAVLRSGAGRALFAWCVETARAVGAVAITVVADPDAAGFYRRMGMRDDGTEPSGSIPGRKLPKLQMAL
ncbi:MAG TPA: GNAT family N-acetyltransferase [Dongiaceae bacterium]|nr:GNAT family N-acetyltransferase [Dongiaceae bacterium]